LLSRFQLSYLPCMITFPLHGCQRFDTQKAKGFILTTTFRPRTGVAQSSVGDGGWW